jgi:sugar O-acyltransferase (sialic acid O-acetyltransferase NeuD family)
MRPLVIFGAGGLGRELLGWINASSEAFRTKWRITAFVADDAAPGATCAGLPVNRRVDFVDPPRYLLAIGSPAARRRLFAELEALGWEAVTWIHETVLVGQGVEIGAGTIVCPFSTLSADTKVGRSVLINGRCGIGHDTEIGNYAVLLGDAAVSGNVSIGEGALVGSAAVIHPGMRVGDGAIVGIGSVVVRNVEPGTSVFGNPARKISVDRGTSS